MPRDPATRQEITERLTQYAGTDAWQEIAAIAQMIREHPNHTIAELPDDPVAIIKEIIVHSKIEYANPPTEPIVRLAALDAQIGGFGIHTLVERLQSSQPPYDMRDRSIYRPIEYVWMCLARCADLEWHTRDAAEMACAHIEGLVKRLADKHNLLERLRSSPLGNLLHQRGVRNTLPKSLWDDLCWLNSAVYVHVKHNYASREYIEPDEVEEERKGHLFSVEEAIAIYLIARYLAVEIMGLS